MAPNEPNVHFELGYLYCTQHDYERAAAQFELELKNNSANAQAYTFWVTLSYEITMILQRNLSWLRRLTCRMIFASLISTLVVSMPIRSGIRRRLQHFYAPNNSILWSLTRIIVWHGYIQYSEKSKRLIENSQKPRSAQQDGGVAYPDFPFGLYGRYCLAFGIDVMFYCGNEQSQIWQHSPWVSMDGRLNSGHGAGCRTSKH